MVSADKVELEGEYFHVRFNNPEMFEMIRTPDWADRVSDSVSQGSEVRMGKLKDEDDWTVQSVLIDKHAVEEKAREQAEKIVEKIES